MNWYLVTCRNGKEEDTKKLIETRIESMRLKPLIKSVVVPTERVLEKKAGRTQEKVRKPFPGYILIQADLLPTSYKGIKETPGVFGFVGDGKLPKPLTQDEVTSFMGRMLAEPHYTLDLNKGDRVQVKEGPMGDMVGVVERVSGPKVYLKVNLMGKQIMAEADLSELEKI